MLAASLLQALRTELQTDPMAIGYASMLAAGAVGAIVAAINTARAQWSVRDSVRPKWELIRWAAANDRRGKLARAAATPGAAQGLALTAIDCLTLDTFDVDEAGVGLVLDALVSLGVLDAADRAAFAGLGDRSPASRAEVILGAGVTVTDGDVWAASP